MQSILEYCKLVAVEVKNTYELDDGGDMCFHLMEAGELKVQEDSIPTAARLVAQYLSQA